MSDKVADISEIFSSVQGEGIFVGARQIFVRFKECNLSCSFCDESRKGPAKKYTPRSLLREIEAIAEKRGIHHSVSLTGGEPLCYPGFLRDFLKLLRKRGMKSYLETNGTLPDELAGVIGYTDIVAMDFKLPSSTGERAFWGEHKKFLKIATKKIVFVKAIVTADTTASDMKKAIRIVRGFGRLIPLILQPVTPARNSGKGIDNKRLLEFMEMGIAGDLDHIRVIPQVHKMMGIK